METLSLDIVYTPRYKLLHIITTLIATLWTTNSGILHRNKIRPKTFYPWKTVSGVGDCVYNALEATNRGVSSVS